MMDSSVSKHIMSQTFLQILTDMNDGISDPQLKGKIPVKLLHDSPYLDHKLDLYLQSNPNARPRDILVYLQSIESDARALLKSIRIPQNLTSSSSMETIIGREKELQLLDIYLNRRYKNNVILIGEPGVGKTSLILYYFKSHHLPLISVSAAEMLSGTKYRGEFEKRMQHVLETAQKEGSTIFFDEIHTLIHAGASEGGVSAANLLKPVITRGDIKVVGATTPEEATTLYADGAFERRFSFLKLKEPDMQTLRLIALNFVKESGENQCFPSSMFEEIVAFLDEKFPNRHYPDKLIDFIDFYLATNKQANFTLHETTVLFAESQI